MAVTSRNLDLKISRLPPSPTLRLIVYYFFLAIMVMDFYLDVLVLLLEACQDYFWK